MAISLTMLRPLPPDIDLTKASDEAVYIYLCTLPYFSFLSIKHEWYSIHIYWGNFFFSRKYLKIFGALRWHNTAEQLRKKHFKSWAQFGFKSLLLCINKTVLQIVLQMPSYLDIFHPHVSFRVETVKWQYSLLISFDLINLPCSTVSYSPVAKKSWVVHIVAVFWWEQWMVYLVAVLSYLWPWSQVFTTSPPMDLHFLWEQTFISNIGNV